MKYLGKFFSLSAGIFIASLPAKGGILASNPYTPIAVRNVFCLQSITPTKLPVEVVVPPVTISLIGFTTILSSPEVLFKTSSAAKLGGRPENEFYTLGEGEMKNDIEVVSIDAKNVSVTFRNHGILQTVQIANNSTVALR
jgi:hypothetical protein